MDIGYAYSGKGYYPKMVATCCQSMAGMLERGAVKIPVLEAETNFRPRNGLPYILNGEERIGSIKYCPFCSKAINTYDWDYHEMEAWCDGLSDDGFVEQLQYLHRRDFREVSDFGKRTVGDLIRELTNRLDKHPATFPLLLGINTLLDRNLERLLKED